MGSPKALICRDIILDPTGFLAGVKNSLARYLLIAAWGQIAHPYLPSGGESHQIAVIFYDPNHQLKHNALTYRGLYQKAGNSKDRFCLYCSSRGAKAPSLGLSPTSSGSSPSSFCKRLSSFFSFLTTFL